MAISPCLFFRKPRLLSSPETMAVEESDSPPASIAAMCHSRPESLRIRKKHKEQTTTCMLPNLNTVLRKTISLGKENSRPRINNRKLSPSSAIAVSSSGSSIIARPVGPNKAPVMRKASSDAMRKRYKSTIRIVDVPSSRRTVVRKIEVSLCKGLLTVCLGLVWGLEKP